MVTPEHVAEVVDRIRDLADEGDGGKATRYRIAVAALASVDTSANAGLARDLLADELGPWGRDLLAEVTRLEAEGVTLDADAEGMLWLDLALVRVLAKVASDEADKAREGRTTKASDFALRWELWADATPLGLVRFAGVVWARSVVERWRRGVERPPAMVHALVHGRLLPLSRPTTTIDPSGDLLDSKGERIAGLNQRLAVATVDLEAMRRGLVAFRSTTAKRLVRFFAQEVHRAEVRGDLRPEIVRVHGGFLGLAERVGGDPKKDAGRVRDLLDFGRMVDVSSPGLEVGGLWHWTNTHATTGRPAVLEVDLCRAVFLAGAAEAMKAKGSTTREAKRARLLVPVLRHDPPYRVRQRKQWGRVWSVADSVLVWLVEHGADLANEGGARLDSKAWRDLVAEAGLDECLAGTVRSILLEGDGVANAMLKQVNGDRFTLADAHAPELAFIVSRLDRSKRTR